MKIQKNQKKSEKSENIVKSRVVSSFIFIASAFYLAKIHKKKEKFRKIQKNTEQPK
jgi:hypothetical protein